MQLQCPHCGRWDSYPEAEAPTEDQQKTAAQREVNLSCSYCSESFSPEDMLDDAEEQEEADTSPVAANASASANTTQAGNRHHNDQSNDTTNRDKDQADSKTAEAIVSFGDTSAYRRQPAPEQKTHFGWLAVVVLLLLLLLAQLAYWQRQQLSQLGPVRNVLASSCSSLGCNAPAPFDLEKINILRHLAVNHASSADRLDLRAVLRNDANFAQAYPDVLVWLDNPDGSPAAAGHFRARDYLGKAAQSQQFAAGERVFINLPLALPNQRISGYRLELIAPEQES